MAKANVLMRVPVIRASNAVTYDGVPLSDKAKVYLKRFIDAFEYDGSQEEIADKVYEVHSEIASDYETYIEVNGALSSTYRRALHIYFTLKWKERK